MEENSMHFQAEHGSEEEIIYEVSERNLFFLFSDFSVSSFFIFLLSLFLLSEEIWLKIIASILLILFMIPLLFNALFFKRLIVYKNKVSIDRYIFGEFSIDIDNIKNVQEEGYVLYQAVRFIHKNNFFFKFYFFVTALSWEDSLKVKKIVNSLIGEKYN